jgi:plasmid stability protein
MPLLQVRDFPDDVYQKLQEKAKSDNRSIAQETVVLLRDSLNLHQDPKSRRKALLKQIIDNPIHLTQDALNPSDLIREDRDR